jgi:hypothetical protein
VGVSMTARSYESRRLLTGVYISRMAPLTL